MAHKLGQIVAAKCTKFKFKLVYTERDTFERVNIRWRRVKEKRECVGLFTGSLTGHCNAHSIKLWHLHWEVLTILTVALLHFNRCNKCSHFKRCGTWSIDTAVLPFTNCHLLSDVTIGQTKDDWLTIAVVQQWTGSKIVKGQSAEEKGGSRRWWQQFSVKLWCQV